MGLLEAINESFHLAAVAGGGLVILVATGCSSTPAGYGSTDEGQALAAEMCESVRGFTRASLDTSGLRRAWFLPFSVYEDGSFDFYAPMASSPRDDASTAFYQKRVGQLTHYLVAPKFAEALADCLQGQYGYTRSCQGRTDESFRASFVDHMTQRAIEISSANDTTSVLIADQAWMGDAEQALRYETDGEQSQSSSMPPTCDDGSGG